MTRRKLAETFKKNGALFKLLSLSACLFLSGCKTALMDPKGAVGLQEKSLILTAMWLMLIVVIPVIVLTVVFAWKYRASNEKAKFRPDWAHSNKVEAVVWGIPCLIIVVLGVITWKTSHTLDPYRPLEAKAKPITIEAVSLDWKWLFIYPDQHIATVNQVVFPANVPVNFKITSGTVMDAFFIPQLGTQIYSMAGMQTRVSLIANEPGTYDGMSANFSGDGFAHMNFKAIAGSQAQFEDWVSKVKSSPEALDATRYEQLAKPSEDDPVQYFSTVKDHLFDDIIAKYSNMPMKSGMSEKKDVSMQSDKTMKSDS